MAADGKAALKYMLSKVVMPQRGDTWIRQTDINPNAKRLDLKTQKRL